MHGRKSRVRRRQWRLAAKAALPRRRRRPRLLLQRVCRRTPGCECVPFLTRSRAFARARGPAASGTALGLFRRAAAAACAVALAAGVAHAITRPRRARGVGHRSAAAARGGQQT
mmetsp:Transcript_15558/g.64558  ORF Transcript_15558/g.64558 Transcript_15558/m.64558 type:complete len:114 (-) Transcript_15558:28-369(-)